MEGSGINNINLETDKYNELFIIEPQSNDQSSCVIPIVSNDECTKIWNILKSWNLECLYTVCLGKNYCLTNILLFKIILLIHIKFSTTKILIICIMYLCIYIYIYIFYIIMFCFYNI